MFGRGKFSPRRLLSSRRSEASTKNNDVDLDNGSPQEAENETEGENTTAKEEEESTKSDMGACTTSNRDNDEVLRSIPSSDGTEMQETTKNAPQSPPSPTPLSDSQTSSPILLLKRHLSLLYELRVTYSKLITNVEQLQSQASRIASKTKKPDPSDPSTSSTSPSRTSKSNNSPVDSSSYPNPSREPDTRYVSVPISAEQTDDLIEVLRRLSEVRTRRRHVGVKK